MLSNDTYLKLKAGDREIWSQAFNYLYSIAYSAARERLAGVLAHQCEDIALETVEELFTQVENVKSDDHLKALTLLIARSKASDELRRHLSKKRGSGELTALEELQGEEDIADMAAQEEAVLETIEREELAEVLGKMAQCLNRKQELILKDYYFEGLSHVEIAEKRGIPMGSVGVFIQRGVESLRSMLARRPQLRAELMASLTEGALVRIMVPMVSVLQCAKWFSLIPKLTEALASAPITLDLGEEKRLRQLRIKHLKETWADFDAKPAALEGPLSFYNNFKRRLMRVVEVNREERLLNEIAEDQAVALSSVASRKGYVNFGDIDSAVNNCFTSQRHGAVFMSAVWPPASLLVKLHALLRERQLVVVDEPEPEPEPNVHYPPELEPEPEPEELPSDKPPTAPELETWQQQYLSKQLDEHYAVE